MTSLHGLDLLWFPFRAMPWTPPLPIPTVASVHDAADASVRAAASHARRIITDSAYCADGLVRDFGVSQDRIDVIPIGVAPPTPPILGRANRFLSETPFVLFVGDGDKSGGLSDLTAAMALLHIEGIDAALDVVRHDDGELAERYRACAVFAYPARAGGPALSVLEAMSYGAPVVASDVGGIREVGGDAALYFAAGSAAALAEALRAILTDDIAAEELRIRGHARAAAMTRRACAELTLAAFRRALE